MADETKTKTLYESGEMKFSIIRVREEPGKYKSPTVYYIDIKSENEIHRLTIEQRQVEGHFKDIGVWMDDSCLSMPYVMKDGILKTVNS